MSPQKLLILFGPVLWAYIGFSQPRIVNLLEMPLLKTEKETQAFLQHVTNGKKPQVNHDGVYRSYSLEGPSFHIEYKIHKDTCIMAGIHFASAGMYNSIWGEVVAKTKPFGENRLLETGSRKLLYMLNPRDNEMTVVGFAFVLYKVKVQKQK